MLSFPSNTGPAETPKKPRRQTWYKRRKSTATGQASGPEAPKTPKRPLTDATPASGEPSSKIRRLVGSAPKSSSRLGPRTPTFTTIKAEEEEPWYTVRRSRLDTLAADSAAGDENLMTPPLTTRPVDPPLVNAGRSAPAPAVRAPIPASHTPVDNVIRKPTPQNPVTSPSHAPAIDVYLRHNTSAADNAAGDMSRMTPPLTTRPIDPPVANPAPLAPMLGPSLPTPVPAGNTPVARAIHKPAPQGPVAGPPHPPAIDVYEFNEMDSDENDVPARRSSGNTRTVPLPASTRNDGTGASSSRPPVSWVATNTTANMSDPTPRPSPRPAGATTQTSGSSPGRRYPPPQLTRLPFTHKRPADLAPSAAGHVARWNQTTLKAALSSAVGMSPGTFMRLIESLEDFPDRPAAPQTGWIWIPSPGPNVTAVECRKLGYAEFEPELVEAALGKDPERRALVEQGKVPLVGYLMYQTLLAAGKRRVARQRKITVKKTQLTLVGLVLSIKLREGLGANWDIEIVDRRGTQTGGRISWERWRGNLLQSWKGVAEANIQCK